MAHRDVDAPPDVRQALEALALLSPKWHPVVLAVLARREPAGFNDLQDAIPDISGKVLSETTEALQDAGLVERTVVSESPLRVEYERTEAGADLEGVFDELAAWNDRHRDSVAPTVLVAEPDRRITEMYGEWLSDRYAVVRAHDGEGIEEALEDGVDVALLAEHVPGVDSADVLDTDDGAFRSILLVDDRPGFDVLEVDCDDVLAMPLVRETALSAIDRQLDRRGETEQRREYGALTAKRTALERAHASETLRSSDRFAELRARIESLEDRIEQ